MSLFERLPTSASTVALTVGMGLPTLPLGLTESMVMVPPAEPPRLPSLLVPDPVRLVALLTVRSTTFLGFGTYDTPHFCWVCSPNINQSPNGWGTNLRKGGGRSPLTSLYSPECVEGRFSEVGLPFNAVLRSSPGGGTPSLRTSGEGHRRGAAQRKPLL